MQLSTESPEGAQLGLVHGPLVEERAAPFSELNGLEKFWLLAGTVEIPLQFDKYFFFRERDAELGAVAGINISITTISLVFLYVLWGMRVLSARAHGIPILRRPLLLGWPMLVYLAAIGASLLVAEVRSLAVFDGFLVAQAYAMFFYVANRLESCRDLTFCIVALAWTILIQSIVIFGLSIMASPGASFHVGPMVLSVWEDGRPAGTMHSAVLAGSTLAILWLPVAATSLNVTSGWVRWFALSATACGLLAIVLTQTRGAILTTIVGSCILGMGLLSRGWLPRFAIYLSLGLAVLSIVPLIHVVQKRIQGDDGGSAVARIHLTSIAAEMIAKRPILGYGAGNCHLAGLPFANQSKYRSEWYYTIHCKYLLVWIETGLLGFMAFLAVLGNGLRHGLGTWFHRDRRTATLGLALAAAILGHMVHLLVDTFNSRTQVQILWLILGIAAAAYRITQELPVEKFGTPEVEYVR